tara:strand:- start:698 stop:1804 length:1107 start_codon:yes stop_codon:yes gene_type:complete
MIIYFIPFTLLSILTFIENSNKFDIFTKNKYFYWLISIIFIFFIGLRHEIGCDWEQYLKMFEKYESLNLLGIIEKNFFSEHKIQELGHVFLTTISKNIYVLNILYSIIFVIPLFYFCSQIKRSYLALLISYPYYIVVIGMGPIRQAACTSLLMLSIILISNKKYVPHFFITISSLLIHQYSIIFNFLVLSPYFKTIKKLSFSKKNIFLITIILSISLYNFPSLLHKTYHYFILYKKISPTGVMIIPPAKSAILIWLMNFLPSFIYISNRNKFNFNNNLKTIFIIFSIFEIFLLPIIFLNSVIAYRLLIYCFPSSIFISAHLVDMNLFNLRKDNLINLIICSSFITLLIWLKFAFHSSCWVPYKNILFL